MMNNLPQNHVGNLPQSSGGGQANSHSSQAHPHSIPHPANNNNPPPSGKRHYQCPVCFKAFIEKANMKRHTQIHLQQRNRYTCDLCTKCFVWKDNYNRHRRTAHDEAPASMPQLVVPLSNNAQPNNGNRNMPQSSNQQGQNHLANVVTNGHCSIPGPSNLNQAIQGSQAAHLSRPHHSKDQFLGSSHTSHSSHSHQNSLPHLQTQTKRLGGKRNHPCPVCLKSFSEKGNMKRHTQIHLQQRNRYTCNLCTKCFAWKDNFNRHRRIAHSDLNQEK